jgi:hypothetical protein
MGRDTATGTSVELPITAGKLDVNATVSPPEGGSTEAKQDDILTALAAPVLPADAATQTTLAALSAKLPAAATPADNVANPSTTSIMGMVMGWNPALSQWGRQRVDSTNYLQVRTHPTSPATTSRSTALQIQRTAAAFSCTPKCVRAFTTTAGWIALFNKATAAADADTPHGGHIYRVNANQTLVIDFKYNASFTTGLTIAHLSQVESGGSLSTVVSVAASCMFTVQYD